MKNLIFAFLFVSSLSFSQEIYELKSRGRVFENGKKLKSYEIENYFGHKPEIIKLYKAGYNKKNIGNFLIWTGATMGVIKLVSDAGQSIEFSFDENKHVEQTSNVLYYVSAGIILIAIPIKIGYPAKFKKAVKLMNEEVNSQKQNTGINLETNIIANSNGIGLKLTF